MVLKATFGLAVGMPMSPNNPKVGAVHVYSHDNFSNVFELNAIYALVGQGWLHTGVE